MESQTHDEEKTRRRGTFEEYVNHLTVSCHFLFLLKMPQMSHSAFSLTNVSTPCMFFFLLWAVVYGFLSIQSSPKYILNRLLLALRVLLYLKG